MSGFIPILTILTKEDIADAVWDEPLSGHQTAGTAGRNLLIAGDILGETTATGTPTATSVIGVSGSAVNDYYNDLELIPLAGPCTGQARIITDYDGSTKTYMIDEPWTAPMVAGNTFMIRAKHNHTITQVQNGLATASALSTLQGFVDTEVAAIKAVTDALPDAGALTSLASAAALTTVDTVVDAIKVKTDSLTFTKALELDANIQSVNGVTVTGTGATGDEWGAA